MSKPVNVKCITCSTADLKQAKQKPCFKQACYKKLCYYKNHEYNKKQQRLLIYKITEKQYDALLHKQNNKCAICNNTFNKTPHIDHSHTNGKVRGLLCNNCNQALGLIKDNTTTALALYDYINTPTYITNIKHKNSTPKEEYSPLNRYFKTLPKKTK